MSTYNKRSEYVSQVDWLMNSRELSLVKRFNHKKGLSVEEENDYIENAEQTLFEIITMRQENQNAFVQGKVAKYQSFCRDGGITKP